MWSGKHVLSLGTELVGRVACFSGEGGLGSFVNELWDQGCSDGNELWDHDHVNELWTS